jgi:hypothetical protein
LKENHYPLAPKGFHFNNRGTSPQDNALCKYLCSRPLVVEKKDFYAFFKSIIHFGCRGNQNFAKNQILWTAFEALYPLNKAGKFGFNWTCTF